VPQGCRPHGENIGVDEDFVLRSIDGANGECGAVLLGCKAGDDARGEGDRRQQHLDQPEVAEADVAVVGNDEMVVQGNAERGGGFFDVLGYGYVGF
jgi:hypothetical protein